MEPSVNILAMEGFNKSLDELLHFADNLKQREKELEQQHQFEIDKQKADYELQLQIEKRRVIELQEYNRKLTEQVERGTKKEVDLEQKHTVLVTKYNCCVEEFKQIKEQHNEKKLRIEELEKIARMLSNEKTKLDNEIKQLKLENQNLQEKIKETPPPPPPPPPPSTSPSPPQGISEEVRNLVQKAIEENQELKKLLTDRDNEIQKLNEQLNRAQISDPQVVEQRLLQLLSKQKNDFRIMYENQFNFILQKIDLLKQEQRDNIASLYKH